MKLIKKRAFTTMANETAQNRGLSWAAKGLLACLLSLPDDWVFRFDHICTLSLTGNHATRTAMNELTAAGYLVKTRARDPKTGMFLGWNWLVSDVPMEAVSEHDSAPQGNGTADYPSCGKSVGRTTRTTDNREDIHRHSNKDKETKKDQTEKEGDAHAHAHAIEPVELEIATGFVPPTKEQVLTLAKSRGIPEQVALHWLETRTCSNWATVTGRRILYWPNDLATWHRNQKRMDAKRPPPKRRQESAKECYDRLIDGLNNPADTTIAEATRWFIEAGK